MDFNSEKKDDEYYMPFHGLEKGLVLQNVRMFSSPKLKTKDCYFLLTKIMYLLAAKGETFTPDEATNVFISVTKLFQSKDPALRRMMYLLLKELTHQAEDTILAFAMLIKDVNSDMEMNRANAIRVISGIMDATMLSQMERYLKQAIVDKVSYVASSALVAAYHMADQHTDIIKRWVTEIQEALNSRSVMLQYHAIGLLHKIRRRDRLAVTKLVTSISDSGNLRSSFGHCLLIRFAVEILEEGSRDPQVYHYLETCLHHKSEIVAYEAARAICRMKNVTKEDLAPAITVLQIMLTSPRPTLRFSAVRTLNSVASTHPQAISGSCAYEMENLISDSNRSVATLAITTLLKIETESSVERLMKQINNFMNDITDEFKIVVVDAIRTLSLKYPDKYYSIVTFLSNMLRDEGGLEYKSAIVNTLFTMIEKIPACTNTALDHLCEFIEDCEYTNLSTKILHLLGSAGPYSAHPSHYIRYIYNRIALENATVRASAISALAKFGLHRPELRQKIIVLLKRSLQDSDDEVRDRSTLYLNMLQEQESEPKSSGSSGPSIVNVFIQSNGSSTTTTTTGISSTLEFSPSVLKNIQSDLVSYIDAPSAQPFNITAAISAAKSNPKPTTTTSNTSQTNKSDKSSAASTAPSQNAQKQPNKDISSPASLFSYINSNQSLRSLLLASVPPNTPLEELLLSSSPVQQLTESDTVAYRVSVRKHLFPRHLLLQYQVTNTIKEQLLAGLTIELGINNGEGYHIETVIGGPSCGYNETVQIFAVISRPNFGKLESLEAALADDLDGKMPTASLWNTLHFKVHSVDAQTGEADTNGYSDEYPLDELDMTVGDYVSSRAIVFDSKDFQETWESQKLGTLHEAVTTFAWTTVSTLQEGVSELVRLLGLTPVEGTEKIPSGANKHLLLLSGTFVEGGKTPVIAEVRMRQANGVQMKLSVRSPVECVSNVIANAVFQ